jgi:putative ABC transport system permease protein
MAHNLRFFWRSLGRNRVHSVITIGGFALSLSVVLILTAYIQTERSYNRHYPNIDRMYQLIREDHSAAIPENTYDQLSSSFPEIECVTMWDDNQQFLQIGQTKGTIRTIYTDENFLDVFSVQVVQGKSELNHKNTILLTRDCASKLFGNTDPLGKEILVWGENYLTVSWQSWKAARRNPIESLRYE